ncbi:MAG: TetR/AcrR family transcriptional regulator [Bacteroidota bacterium]
MPKRTKHKPTKQLILKAALLLFNRDGFVNVRLQHIADEAFVSVGNLAYHFPNKAAIFEAIYDTLTSKQRALLAEFKVVPLFDYIDRLIIQTYQLQESYLFFYQDTLELLRAFPDVAAAHRRHIAWQEGMIKGMLDFNVARGAFEPEPWPGLYGSVAARFREFSDSYRALQQIRGNEAISDRAFSEALWAFLIPFFTDTGKLEYRQMRQLPSGELF